MITCDSCMCGTFITSERPRCCPIVVVLSRFDEVGEKREDILAKHYASRAKGVQITLLPVS